ncbi:MAG: carbohydrate ABC transporter permease [Aggregatilineales bacterium]
MKLTKWQGLALTTITWVFALIMFFPIIWTLVTSLKTEREAFNYPPSLIPIPSFQAEDAADVSDEATDEETEEEEAYSIFFTPTLDNYNRAIFDADFGKPLVNTLVITIVSTFMALLLGIPASYALAYKPDKRSNFTLLWLISTRMLPPAGVIVPLFLLARDLSLLDTRLGMIIIYTGMNIPLVIWMMRSFLLDVPYEILEAGRIDGVTLFQEFRHLVLPLVAPGLFATALLCMIFAWNEFFFSFNITKSQAEPLTVYISSFKSGRGQFIALMSAASTLSVLPVVIAGWIAQRQLVQGLTMGAVK